MDTPVMMSALVRGMLLMVGTTYNPWLGSAIALVMMVIVLVCMAIMNRFGEGEEGVSFL